MRGAIRSFWRFILGALLIAVTSLSFGTPSVVKAAGLDLARDMIGSFISEAPNIVHEIYFVLPTDSQQVTSSDWITVDFPNYTEINRSGVFLTGSFGTPQITLVGNQLRITNVALLPGSGLTINGLTATNPPSHQSNQIILTIAQDSGHSVVRNQITVIPTDSRSVVNVSATIQSELSAVSITGYTSANTFTTLTEGFSVLGTTVSDNSGFFAFHINAIDPGAHSFRMYSTDASGRSSSQTSLNLFLLANNITSASGILLSPALSLSTDSIRAGETLTISGSAKPNSQINIFLEAPLRSYTTTSDSTGAWSYILSATETQSMNPGQYRVYSAVQDNTGNQSIVSPTLNFEVISVTTGGSNPPPACNISRGDLNCNNVTNLVDFSILLFHWNTNHRVADINGDGSVNLVDFSIMMFYYT